MFIFFSKLSLKTLFSENEIKRFDNIFYFFAFTNFLGLSSFYMSFPLWPQLIIFLRFFFWLQSIISLLKNSLLFFFKHLSQENLIIFITCFIVYIEFLRVFIRFITLGFRLLANILGGHLIIELAYENSGNIFLIVALISYEGFVCFIQAVIFRILVYFYTVEAIEKF